MLEVELERHLNELLNFLAPDLRRRKFHAGERFLDGGSKRWIARVENLDRAHVGAAVFVDDELERDRSFDARVLQLRRELRLPIYASLPPFFVQSKMCSTSSCRTVELSSY